MVAGSITDSQLFHGSPISRAFFKKRKANWLRKLKQRKIDDARRSQWIHQWKKENVIGDDSLMRTDEDNGSDRLSQLQAWSIDDDSDETSLSAASDSPTSVLNNKDSESVDNEDCFSCSKQITEEKEEEEEEQAGASVDANENPSDDYSDVLRMFYEESPSQSDSSPSTEKAPDQEKKEDDECPLCAEKMDETDLLFKPCSCGYKMCLFCYNTISEDTGVCPGCRKKYEKQTSGNSGVGTFQQRGGARVKLSSSFKGLDSA